MKERILCKQIYPVQLVLAPGDSRWPRCLGTPFPRKSSPPRPLPATAHRRPGAAAASTPGNPDRHPRHGSPGSPAPAGPASATSTTSSAAARGCCWCGRRTKAAGSRCRSCASASPITCATKASEPCSRQSGDSLAAAETHPRGVRPGGGGGGLRRARRQRQETVRMRSLNLGKWSHAASLSGARLVSLNPR